MNFWVMPYHHQSLVKFKYVFWNGGRGENLYHECFYCNHIGPERDRWTSPLSNSSSSFQKSLTALSTASSRSVFGKFEFFFGFTIRAIWVLGSIVLKFNILFFLRIKIFPDDFQPIFEFIIWPFKAPDKGEINEFDHRNFIGICFLLRLLLVNRSKSHHRYLNTLK